jgi:hypothetical protein
MLNWFTKSNDIPSGTTQNEIFAERLNSVWFKYSGKAGAFGTGVASARLGKFLTDLHERVRKLEIVGTAPQHDDVTCTSSNVGSNHETNEPEMLLKYRQSVALYYGIKFLEAMGDAVTTNAHDREMEQAVIEAGKRLRFERKEHSDV